MKKLTMLALGLLLSGCVQIQPRLVPFDEAAFEGFDKPGNCTITGQAFLKTLGGDVKHGAGCEITLAPDVPYTREYYERRLMKRVRLKPPDPGLAPHLRSTTADGDGRFEFNDLPPGKYLLYTTITWFVTSAQISGDFVYGEATVEEGRPTKVLLTKIDPAPGKTKF